MIILQPFTKKEKQIIELIQKGYSNKYIAELMGLSYHTIMTHLNSIYSKTDIPHIYNKRMALSIFTKY